MSQFRNMQPLIAPPLRCQAWKAFAQRAQFASLRNIPSKIGKHIQKLKRISLPRFRSLLRTLRGCTDRHMARDRATVARIVPGHSQPSNPSASSAPTYYIQPPLPTGNFSKTVA